MGKLTEEQLKSVKEGQGKINAILVEIGFLEAKKAEYLGAHFEALKALEEVKSELKILPMQVSAMKPMAIDKESLDPKVLDDETDIIKKQLGEVNPDKIDQIITGKLSKFIKENTLLDQSLISDPKMTVSKLLEDLSSKNDISLKIMLMDLYSI